MAPSAAMFVPRLCQYLAEYCLRHSRLYDGHTSTVDTSVPEILVFAACLQCGTKCWYKMLDKLSNVFLQAKQANHSTHTNKQ